MFRWLRARGINNPTTPDVTLDAIAIDDAPFRAIPTPEAAEPARRTTDPRTLADVIAQLERVGSRPKPLRRGFEIPGHKGGVLRGFVRDPDRVVPASFELITDEAEMAIDLAHALVPSFGPIGANYGQAGWLVIDGKRPVAEIRDELGKRYAAMMMQMAAALDDLLAPLLKPLELRRGTLPEEPQPPPGRPPRRDGEDH